MITKESVIAVIEDGSLAQKITKAEKRIKRVWDLYSTIRQCIGHSGGKDSIVVHHLVSSLLSGLPVIHSAKLDGENAIHPETLKFIYGRPFKIIYYPRSVNHSADFDLQYDGTRADEFERLDKSSDLIVNGKSISREHMSYFNTSGLFGMKYCYPIFDWTDSDVWAYIWAKQLDFSKEYSEERKVLKELA